MFLQDHLRYFLHCFFEGSFCWRPFMNLGCIPLISIDILNKVKIICYSILSLVVTYLYIYVCIYLSLKVLNRRQWTCAQGIHILSHERVLSPLIHNPTPFSSFVVKYREGNNHWQAVRMIHEYINFLSSS